MTTNLNGTWRLKDYQMVKNNQVEFHDDINGLLIYSDAGWFSLNLKYPENPKTPYSKNIIRNYFFGGKYSVEGSEIAEENLVHVVDEKVGEKRKVKIKLENDTLTRVSDFGESTLTTSWVRV